MKFRTDFVTNSSSSSFIAVKAITLDGKQYCAELESGNVDIDVNAHSGRFEFPAKDFENLEAVSDLFSSIYKWFYDSLLDPACAQDEPEEALRIYGSGDFKSILSLRKENLRFVAVFSREEFCDEPFGASLISYDYTQNAFFEEHREKYNDEEDCYGSELGDRFRDSTSFDSICIASESGEE